MPRGVTPEQEGVHDSLIAENDLPGISAHQVTDPEWDDHGLVQHPPVPARLKNQKTREWVADREREQHHRERDPHGAENHGEVERRGCQVQIIC